MSGLDAFVWILANGDMLLILVPLAVCLLMLAWERVTRPRNRRASDKPGCRTPPLPLRRRTTTGETRARTAERK